MAKTKVAAVIAMCSRKSGCTLEQIAAALSVSPTAAYSLISDARYKKGQRIERKKGAKRVNRYYLQMRAS